MSDAARSVRALCAALDPLLGQPNPLYNHDFLLTWEHDDRTVRTVLALTDVLERCHRLAITPRVFPCGLAVSIFRDKSTRTRFSFASASSFVGLALQELDETRSQIAHGETVRETATMISFLTQVIGIRDDIFLHEGHSYMTEVARALEESHAEGVLMQRPAVINLQCDMDHPTQSLADLKHLADRCGGLEGLRGKRLVMSWAYSPSYGKPLSVAQGIIGLMTRCGMHVTLAHPPGYDLLPEVLQVARRQSEASSGTFSCTERMDEAFEGADIVYPKSWAPYQVMEERTRLLRQGDQQAELQALELRCLEENARHRSWECNAALMARTRAGHALYMHCLPADISQVSCEAGEVTAEVFERYRLLTYHEASHKPFVISALMLMTRLADPALTLSRVLERQAI